MLQADAHAELHQPYGELNVHLTTLMVYTKRKLDVMNLNIVVVHLQRQNSTLDINSAVENQEIL